MNLNEKIEAARQESAQSLEATIQRLTEEQAILDVAPPLAPSIKAIHRVRHNQTANCVYEAHTLDEVKAIAAAWREMYGPFLEIGEFRDGCVSVTAYPWGKYVNMKARSCLDAVEFRSSVGTGFSSLEFSFNPAVPDKRIEVTIRMAFRSYVPEYMGRVVPRSAHWNNSYYEKVAPKRLKECAFAVQFAGGGPDSACWVGVMPYEEFDLPCKYILVEVNRHNNERSVMTSGPVTYDEAEALRKKLGPYPYRDYVIERVPNS